ncbi:kinase domain protein (macronuclear) [Tetrahymena thermophila SB210]|uniref:Cyclin-dependent kinase 2 homolog n=1 Tax=Tetrahymena thermophila (strain SB210) TaxID=312017 RepID=I7MJ53_TETTS|nr:kinase domain protein [Tetrahymena thermophila SB210]EAR95972.1 kinase domain protein [Tetrahymena thermophila SB210]|eukprot:XP_001016217.1 kinase domain protein [Tetrahymena thermophila SB210]
MIGQQDVGEEYRKVSLNQNFKRRLFAKSNQLQKSLNNSSHLNFLQDSLRDVHIIYENQYYLIKRVENVNKCMYFTQVVPSDINNFDISSMNHENILQIHQEDNIFIAEPMLMTLQSYIYQQQDVSHDLEQIIKQIVNFISFLHSQNLAHTELSTRNFLINEKLQIKAVPLPQEGVQYRAPERIIGYDVENMKSEDMFQLGCIILELLARKPVLESEDETNQMLKYSLFLGRPQEIIYRNIYHQLPDTSPVDIDKYLSNCDQKLVNLIPQLLVYDPEKRATIQQVQNYLNQVYPSFRPSSKSSISNSPLSLKSQRMTPYSLRNRNKRYGNINNGSPNYYYQDETPSINLYEDSPNDLSPKFNVSKKTFDEQMRTIAEETSLNNDGMSQLREKIQNGKQNNPSIDNNQGAQQYNKSQHPRNYSSASNTQNNLRLQSSQKPQTPQRYKQNSLLFDNDDNLKPQIIQDRMTPLSNRRSNNNSFQKNNNNNNTPGKGFFIDVPDKEKNIQDHLTSFQHLQKIFSEENKHKTDDEKKRKLEEDLRKQADEEKKRRDEEEKRKKDYEEKKLRDEAEKKKRDEEEKRKRDEEEKKKRDEEEEKKKRDDEEKKKRDDEEKKKRNEDEKIKRDLDDKKKKEDEEKRQRDEEEKRKKDDLQKKKDDELKQIQDDEKKKKLEEELRKKLEEEQKKKELELKRQMEEEQNKREQERQKQFEAQKLKQEQEMKKKIEEEQKRIEEQLRKQFEQQQKQKEDELKKKEEEQRKKDEELKKKEEEKLKLEQELKKKEEALKLKEEEDRKLREELAKKENQQKQEEQQKLLKAQKEAEEKLRKQLEEEQEKIKKLQEELLKKKKEDEEITKQKQLQDQKAKEEEIRQLKEKQEQLAEQERKQKEIAAELERKEKLAQEALKNQQLQIQEEARKKEEQMLQELKKKEEELQKQKEQAELDRKKKQEELEQQRQREQEEIQKKQELLKQKEQELEKQKKADEEKQREFEEQKKRELENQKKKEMELNQLKEQELAKLKEIEEKRQRDEQEKQNKQREEEKRLQEIEKQKKKELQDLMKQKELERQKLKELEEKEKELAKKKGEDQKKIAELEKQKKYQQQQQQQPKESDENIRLQKEDSQNESSKKPLKQPKSSSKLIQTDQSLDDKKANQGNMNNNNNQGNIVILPESMQRQQMISNILQQEIEFNEIYRQRQGYSHYRFKNNQLSTPNSNIIVNTRYSQQPQQNHNSSKVSPQMYDSKQSFYPQNNYDNNETNPSLNFRTPRINTDHSTIKSALINTNDRNNQNPNQKMESPVSNIHNRIKQKIQLNGNTIVVEETPENSINSLGNQPSYQPVYKEQQPRIINKNKPIIPPLRSIATSLPPATDRRKQSPPLNGTDRKSKENKKFNTLNKSIDVKKKKKKSKGGSSEIKGNYNNNDYKMPPLSARNESFQYLQDERTKFRQSHDGQLITQSNTDSIPSIINPARMSQQHMYLQTKPDQPTVFNTRLLARPPTFLVQKDTDED